MGSYWVDILAVSFFVIEWVVYGFTLEHTAYGRNSLSSRMNVYREVWVRRLLDREARMVDMQVMISLQNGTAFFASTSLLAIGGGLALLRATDDALGVLSKLPIDISPSPALWEIKCVGLILIFVYAFFKFAWSYRLFNYVAILVGAMPPAAQRDTPEAQAHVMRTTRLFESAGWHFNRGQRAFFFALGYLGWFVSPWVLFFTTALVVVVTWRRQFASNAWRAMGS
jgi:Predicted membrane protein